MNAFDHLNLQSALAVVIYRENVYGNINVRSYLETSLHCGDFVFKHLLFSHITQSSAFHYKIINRNYWVSGLCPSSTILNTRKQCFGNWICFHPQAKEVGHLLSWAL
jgi:hypothetical protein